MLDRFDHMVQDMIDRKMIDLLYSLDSLEYIDLPDSDEVYALALIMAEAGVRRLTLNHLLTVFIQISLK